jgi:uncharacterized protein
VKTRTVVRGCGSRHGLVWLALTALSLSCGDDDTPPAPAPVPADAGLGPADAAPSIAAEFAGTWLGTVEVASGPIRFVLNLEHGAGGVLAGTADSPDQGSFGIPITSVDVTGYHVIVRLDAIALAVSADLSMDGETLTGTLRQGGASLPIVFVRQPGPIDYSRPQDPVPPFPYDTVEVTFPSEEAGVTLAGTLISPRGAGPFTTVVLITGSGPQDRNEELANHRPFLVLADALARSNVAVLRFDDRGVGDSTGNFDAATTLSFAADVRGAVSYLRSQTQVPVGPIGLVGHSEGGLIAPLVAEGNADVGFLVLLAGPAVDGEAIVVSQRRALDSAMGVPAEQLDANDAQQHALYACFRNPGAASTADAGVDAGVSEAGVTDAELDACLHQVLTGAGLSEVEVVPALAQLESPWTRFFITYDPAPALRRTRVPVLALNGSLDLQVIASVNVPVMRAALAEAGNPLSSVSELPGLNHLFQHATTGAPSEYALIDETMAPEVLAQVAAWIGSLPAPTP